MKNSQPNELQCPNCRVICEDGFELEKHYASKHNHLPQVFFLTDIGNGFTQERADLIKSLIPRCSTCSHWQNQYTSSAITMNLGQFEEIQLGSCDITDSDGNIPKTDTPTRLLAISYDINAAYAVTESNFGCVMHSSLRNSKKV